MASLQSKVLVLFLKVTRRKRPYTDVRVFRARIEEERKTIDHEPPAALSERCTIDRREIHGAPAYTIKAKAQSQPESSAAPSSNANANANAKPKPKPKGRILYLHGGCYVFEITPHHWMFCAWLAETLGMEVTIPIYPLAPEHTVEDALRMVMAVYREITDTDEDPEPELTIMGDSAGGGMALALAQLLHRAKTPQQHPKHIVLLSPWLDATMSNPDVPAADANDPWLSRAGLVEAGAMYAGSAIDPKDHRVSPLNGDVEKLAGTISIFIGTRDILLPDARLLASRARDGHLFEYEEMVHDFMLIDFLPEAHKAREDIASILR